MPDNNAVKLYETKPGWQSSEFWLVLATNLVLVLELCADPFNIENKWVLLAGALVNAIYATARGVAKSGIEYGEINEALLAAEGEPEPQKIEAEVTIADEKPKPISRRR
jgi:hypothetical protein